MDFQGYQNVEKYLAWPKRSTLNNIIIFVLTLLHLLVRSLFYGFLTCTPNLLHVKVSSLLKARHGRMIWTALFGRNISWNQMESSRINLKCMIIFWMAQTLNEKLNTKIVPRNLWVSCDVQHLNSLLWSMFLKKKSLFNSRLQRIGMQD